MSRSMTLSICMLLMTLGLLVMWLSLPAQAQDVRGPNGNLLYRYSQEGSRTVRRDPNGNMIDYSQKSGSGIEYRTPNGNLIARENLPHR